jgi:subtilisin family serine protease
MKERLAVLRKARLSTRDTYLGPFKLATEEAPISPRLSLEVEEIERSQIPTLRSHSDVVALAPSIPMKLVTPMDSHDLPSPSTAGTAWGVKAVGADTSPFTGDGIIVAVLDTGIDRSHPAFTGMQLVEKDFTGGGNGDTHGHGTHCAGTIFGRDLLQQRIGIAQGVKTALIGKVLGNQGGSSIDIISAINWAVENGASIISMSLGMDFPGFVDQLVQDGLPTELAVARALEGYRANVQLFERLAALIRSQEPFSHPTMIIAAAGNESRRDQNPDFEIGVSPPAVSDGVISVAALGKDTNGLVVASFSNTFANISAPGVDIVSAKAGGGLRSMSGTSMATPHVAGVAALWAEKIKNSAVFSNLQLTSRLLSSATTGDLKPGFDPNDVGFGLVKAPQS